MNLSDIAEHSGGALVYTIGLSKDIQRFISLVPGAATDMATLRSSLHTVERCLVNLRYLDEANKYTRSFPITVLSLLNKYELLVLEMTTTLLKLITDAKDSELHWPQDGFEVRRISSQIGALTLLMDVNDLATRADAGDDGTSLMKDIANLRIRSTNLRSSLQPDDEVSMASTGVDSNSSKDAITINGKAATGTIAKDSSLKEVKDPELPTQTSIEVVQSEKDEKVSNEHPLQSVVEDKTIEEEKDSIEKDLPSISSPNGVSEDAPTIQPTSEKEDPKPRVGFRARRRRDDKSPELSWNPSPSFSAAVLASQVKKKKASNARRQALLAVTGGNPMTKPLSASSPSKEVDQISSDVTGDHNTPVSDQAVASASESAPEKVSRVPTPFYAMKSIAGISLDFKMKAREIRILSRQQSDGEWGVLSFLMSMVVDFNTNDMSTMAAPLHEAAARFDIAKVQELVNSVGDVDAKHEHDITPLHLALTNAWFLHEITKQKQVYDSLLLSNATADLKNAVSVIQHLLDAGADINAKFDCGTTFLHEIMLSTDQTYLKPLFDLGVDINARDSRGQSALHMARGVLAMRKLLNAGADINAKAYNGHTILYTSLNDKDPTMAKLLLDRGADVNFTINGQSLLHLTDNSDFVKLFIAAGADVNARDDELQTPLHTWHRKPAMLKLLLEAEADINARGKEGETALYQAVRHQNRESVKVLIEKGANVNLKEDSDGRAALHRAATEGVKDPWLIETLLSAGADVNIEDKKGRTVIYYACNWGHADLIKIMIKAGANPKTRSTDKKSPFSRTLMFAHTECARLLIENGESVVALDNDGLCALHYTIQNHQRSSKQKDLKDMIALLVDSGADINSPWYHGKHGPFTALTYAMEYGDLPTIMELTEHGAIQREVTSKPKASKFYQSAAFKMGTAKRYLDKLAWDWWRSKKESDFTLPHWQKGVMERYKTEHKIELTLPEEYFQPPYTQWKDVPLEVLVSSNVRLFDIIQRELDTALKHGKEIAKERRYTTAPIDDGPPNDEKKSPKIPKS